MSGGPRRGKGRPRPGQHGRQDRQHPGAKRQRAAPNLEEDISSAATQIARQLNRSSDAKGGDVPASGLHKPRRYTVSVAIPGSIVDNAQTFELQTYLAGEIARALTVANVDEVVVWDDGMGLSSHKTSSQQRRHEREGMSVAPAAASGGGAAGKPERGAKKDDWDCCDFLSRILEFLETPQYLRKPLFPRHPHLRLAGLLNPLDAPHHMRKIDRARWREGVVMDPARLPGSVTRQFPRNWKESSVVNVGLANPVVVEEKIPINTRVTVDLGERGTASDHPSSGMAVASSAPREEWGIYWGFTTRRAQSIAHVFSEAPFDGGYDVTVGTSERGKSVDDADFSLPPFKHLLIVLGGVEGLEAAVDASEDLPISGSKVNELFDEWINTCPGQGSRTIRTEEALVFTLASLRRFVNANQVPA